MARIRIKNGYVVLYDEVLFNDGGEVGEWFQRKSVEFHGRLTAWAPERTGRLKRSIKVDEKRSGLRERQIAVRFGVKYAGYTDKGTKGPITAGGKLMPVGRSQGASGKSRYRGIRRLPGGGFQMGVERAKADYYWQRGVNGQPAQNWVSNAVRSVKGWERYSG